MLFKSSICVGLALSLTKIFQRPDLFSARRQYQILLADGVDHVVGRQRVCGGAPAGRDPPEPGAASRHKGRESMPPATVASWVRRSVFPRS